MVVTAGVGVDVGVCLRALGSAGGSRCGETCCSLVEARQEARCSWSLRRSCKRLNIKSRPEPRQLGAHIIYKFLTMRDTAVRSYLPLSVAQRLFPRLLNSDVRLVRVYDRRNHRPGFRPQRPSVSPFDVFDPGSQSCILFEISTAPSLAKTPPHSCPNTFFPNLSN